jgi:hypothetical protein
MKRRAWTYTAEGHGEAADGILRTGDPAIQVDLAQVFAGLES